MEAARGIAATFRQKNTPERRAGFVAGFTIARAGAAPRLDIKASLANHPPVIQTGEACAFPA